MAKLITFGLAKIEFADILPDGSTGTTFTQLGYTMKDTCKFTSDDPTENPIEVEEVDDAIDFISKAGKKNLAYSLADPDETALASLFGGVAVTTPGSESWEAPATYTPVEKTIRVTPTKGLILLIPRCKINAKWNGDYSKSSNFKIDVTGTVMTPNKEGLKPFSTTRVPTT